MEFEISKLRRTNSRSNTEISQLQDENTRLKSEISQFHEENSRLKSEISQLQKDIDCLKSRCSELMDTPLVVAEITDTLPNNEVCLRSFDYPGKYIIKAPSEMAGILKTGMTVAARMEGAGTPGAIVKIMNNTFDSRVRLMELEESPKVTFEDIGGLKDVIEEVREAVEYPLTKPEAFVKMGVEPPKGVLLCGPPGTGKTLIARAIANQAKATFIRLSGSELLQKYVGEGARLVREIFDLAREKSPSILFIDEIDAFGTARTSDNSSSRSEAEILIQFLTKMDGFDNRGNVRIMAATNRVDMLDHALLRPGRFDRILEILLPDADSRREIFRIHSAKLPLAADLDIDTVLGMTEGTTGAEIQSICREAAMFAIRRNADSVTGNDFGNAVAKVRKTGKPVKYTDIMYY
ncbi:MAG: AAA family ATPase [Methanomicrobium sp.]|nr:AAA family ATPase [Methanomicrobium sp.]